jgi:hypothetical protein
VTGNPLAAVGVPSSTFAQNVFDSLKKRELPGIVIESINSIFQLLEENGIIWIKRPLVETHKLEYLKATPSVSDFRKKLDERRLYQVWNVLTDISGGAIEQHWIPETLKVFLEGQSGSLSFPIVQLIPAIRQIGPKSEQFSDFSGRGLVDRLAEIQSPDHDKRHERRLFDAINRKSSRRSVRRKAHIMFAGSPPRDCMVMDLSDGGVRLFAAGVEVPDRFVLLLADYEGHAKPRECRVAWRSDFNIGAEFLDTAADHDHQRSSVHEPAGA